LKDKHIYHIGDIIDDRYGERQWAIPENEDWLSTVLPATPPVDMQFNLWPGQFWRPYQQLDGVRLSDVVEIVHVLDGIKVEITRWKMHDRDARTTRYWRQDNNTIVPIADLLKGDTQNGLIKEGS
jgi:hypothetical protein